MAEPPKEPDKPATDPPDPAKPATATTDANPNMSHFDEKDGDGTGETASAGAEHRRAVGDGLTMFGTRTSGVVVIGDGNHFSGGVFGGDGGGFGDRSGPIVAAVAERTITEINAVYVPPDGFDTLGEPIARHHLVLLGSRARWGNTATAIRLLAGPSPAVATDGAIYELGFSGGLAELPVDQLPPGAGFVLEAADARALAALRLQYLEDLEDRLAKAGSRLVVITDADRAAEHGGRPVWRTLATPPQAYDLVLRHLTHRVGSPEQAVELIEQAGAVAELRAMTADTFDVHRLVELACDLAEAAGGRGTLAEAIDRFAARADRAVEEWLDAEVDDAADLALVLALAVLNGMPYDAVSRAAVLLERRWAAQEPATGRTRRNRRDRLKAARARLSAETWQTRYGMAALEIASFIDGTYPQRILRHYWHEHDYDRELLLDWLRELADDVETLVATRAAVAVGYLGTFAFDTIRRDVIAPWVASGKGNERELAVAALALPARAPETAARAVGLVADWSRRNGTAAKLTAARALGSSVGAVLSGGSDASLTRLAKGADGRLATALGDSVAELIVDAEPDRTLQLLGLLDAWSAERRTGRQLAGVLGFLQASWTLWTRVGEASWPSLLRLAEQGGGAREVIARLWGRALIAPGADNGVRIVLGSWAHAAERHASIRPAFVSLFAAAATTSRQAGLLKTHAERLRTGKPGAPDIARKLLDALTEGAIRDG